MKEGLAKYQSYPKYMPSGVGWIGDIPEKWEVKRLRFIVRYNLQTLSENCTDPNYEIEYLDIGNVDGDGNIISTENLLFRDAPSRARRIVENGNTIISTVRTYLKAIAFLEKIPDNMIASTGFAVIQPQRATVPKYLFYFFRSQYFVEQVVMNSKGVSYPAVTPSQSPFNLIDIPIILAPYHEQQTISDFLDRETTRINAIIEKQNHLIELLKEKRSALITQAVTKGLDPNVKMKSSEVKWIGTMPEGWGVRHLKRIAEIAYGVGGEIDTTLTEGVNLLSLPNVRIDGEIDLETRFFVDKVNKESLLRKYDLLFNWRNGSADHLGKTAYFDLEGLYSHVSFLLRIRFTSEGSYPRYYFRLLNGLREKAFFSSSKAGVNNTFNQTELKNLLVPIPPYSVQQSIADFLDRETGKIDTLVSKIQKQIDLLNEYKQSLITAAVTGKIDVRDSIYATNP